MDVSLRSAWWLVLSAPLAAGACGGNVVVDTAPGSGGNGGVTTTLLTMSSSGVTTVGTGGGTTVTTITTTTTFGTSSSSSSTSSTSSSTSTSTGTFGACTDGSDFMTLHANVIYPAEVQCVTQNLNNMAAIQTCIVAATGLSLGCSKCATNDVSCAVQHCLNQCISSPTSQSCAGCRTMNCESSYTQCSGLPQEPGTLDCAVLLGNGPTSMPWRRNLDAADFASTQSNGAYLKYDGCACSICAGECGTDYCNNQVAGPMCAACITQNCGSQYSFCETN